MGLKPIAYGRGPLPDCVEGVRHVFAPGVMTCRCKTTSRPSSPLGAITVPREALSASLRREIA